MVGEDNFFSIFSEEKQTDGSKGVWVVEVNDVGIEFFEFLKSFSGGDKVVEEFMIWEVVNGISVLFVGDFFVVFKMLVSCEYCYFEIFFREFRGEIFDVGFHTAESWEVVGVDGGDFEVIFCVEVFCSFDLFPDGVIGFFGVPVFDGKEFT